MTVTGIVLLIACANIANLLLARGAGRATEMASGCRSAPAARQLLAQLLTESCVLAVLGGIAGLVVARWTLTLVASLLPPEATSTLEFDLQGRVVLFAAVAVDRHRSSSSGCFPALAQHEARSRLRDQGAGRAAVRRARGRAVPHVSGHRADRAVDGAAHVRGALRQEPDEREPRRPRHQDRQRRHLRHLARLERLRAGALEGALRTLGAGARRHSGRHRRRRGARRRSLPATTGATMCRSKDFSAARTPTPGRATTRSIPAISARWACR